jgi:YesN/AraC family two-component response regulator
MLGIVSDDDFLTELQHCEFKGMNHGRNRKEVPQLVREIIAEEAISGMPAAEISEKYGISESSISAYKHDATSTATYDQPDKQLAKSNDRVRNEIITTARQKLFDALREITAEKLANSKVRDIASVAKDMSAVIHNTEPITTSLSGAQFVFHVPVSKKETDYEVIDVT